MSLVPHSPRPLPALPLPAFPLCAPIFNAIYQPDTKPTECIFFGKYSQLRACSFVPHSSTPLLLIFPMCDNSERISFDKILIFMRNYFVNSNISITFAKYLNKYFRFMRQNLDPETTDYLINAIVALLSFLAGKLGKRKK